MDSENTALRNLSEASVQSFVKSYIKFDKCLKLKKLTESTYSKCLSRCRQGTFDIPAEKFLLNSGNNLTKKTKRVKLDYFLQKNYFSYGIVEFKLYNAAEIFRSNMENVWF